MTPVTVFKEQKLALFGLGASGLSSARALIAGGAGVLAWDDSEKSRNAAAQADIPLGDLRNADWSQFSALVLAPGVPLTHPEPHWTVKRARECGIEVIGDVELFCRERARIAPDALFVAITGTNGKSTTTALTGHILQHAGRDVQVGGNLGTPILALEPPASSRVHVIELSSYQIDLAPSLKPSVGVMLNVTPDHLDRHGDMQRYAFVKSQVPGRAEVAVIGIDDDYGREMARALKAKGKSVIELSNKALPQKGYAAGERHLYRVDGSDAEEVADLSGIGSLRGAHNAQNAMAAFATCSALRLDDAAIRAGLKSFPGLAHRMEEVARIGRVLFVNDSKATNADSTAKALGSFENIYWIAGGKPKAGGIASLAEFFPRIRKAYLIGEAADDFAATLDGKVAYEQVVYDIVKTLENAVPQAARDAAESGHEAVVLLSPACASFDQFQNFEIRGDRFRDLVKMLPGA